MQQATYCVDIQARNRIEMNIANDEKISSINENSISTLLSPLSAPNSRMLIENNAHESN